MWFWCKFLRGKVIFVNPNKTKESISSDSLSKFVWLVVPKKLGKCVVFAVQTRSISVTMNLKVVTDHCNVAKLCDHGTNTTLKV